MPFAEEYLVESLSDSTIYMSYYTIAHYLQGDMKGSVRGDLDIGPTDMTHKDWDYVFLNKEYESESKVSEDKLKTMRESFR